jgi:alpha-glucosidase (family GH31 glycosyl hydrolase)
LTATAFQFPNDENTYKNYEDTFIVGGNLLIAPVLDALKEIVEPYLPTPSKWYNRENKSFHEGGSTPKCTETWKFINTF